MVDVQRDALVPRSHLVQRPAEQLAPRRLHDPLGAQAGALPAEPLSEDIRPGGAHGEKDSVERPHTRRRTALAVGREGTIATYLAFHEVDDVEHWLSSPNREAVFGPL